jgi:hypothetical protein
MLLTSAVSYIVGLLALELSVVLHTKAARNGAGAGKAVARCHCEQFGPVGRGAARAEAVARLRGG